MPSATAVLAISSSFPHMATTGGRTTRRRSRGDTFINDEGIQERDMPASKRRREDKKPSTSGAVGPGRPMNLETKKLKPEGQTAYDEEDDGFAFTRKSRAMRTRSAKSAISEPMVEERTPPPVLTPSRTTKIRSTRSKRVIKKQRELTPPQPLLRPDPQLKHPVRPPKREQDENSHYHHYTNIQDLKHTKTSTFGALEQSMEDAGLTPISPRLASPSRHHRKTKKESVAKVVIPLSDTPIIQRNRQFRKDAPGGGSSSRRSSLGLRGRRASSLIDNGQVAYPHPELDSEDFYKHIDAELVEPRRMKQLLIWCAKRASAPPPSNKIGGDGNAHAIARIIQEDIVKDLLEKAELSNWFKREDQPASAIVKKPNPRNVDNLAKAQEGEATLQRLKEEHRSWELLTKKADAGGTLPIPKPLPKSPLPASLRLQLQLQSLPPSLPHPSAHPQPPLSSDPITALSEQPQDPPLLTDREATFISTILPTISSAVTSAATYLDETQKNLEHNVDLLDDGLHQLAKLNNTAEDVAGRVLKQAEEKLRKRDVRIKREAGTEGLGIRDVLKSITRVDV